MKNKTSENSPSSDIELLPLSMSTKDERRYSSMVHNNRNLNGHIPDSYYL
jgi:hypothetical protein